MPKNLEAMSLPPPELTPSCPMPSCSQLSTMLEPKEPQQSPPTLPDEWWEELGELLAAQPQEPLSSYPPQNSSVQQLRSRRRPGRPSTPSRKLVPSRKLAPLVGRGKDLRLLVPPTTGRTESTKPRAKRPRKSVSPSKHSMPTSSSQTTSHPSSLLDPHAQLESAGDNQASMTNQPTSALAHAPQPIHIDPIAYVLDAFDKLIAPTIIAPSPLKQSVRIHVFRNILIEHARQELSFFTLHTSLDLCSLVDRCFEQCGFL